MITGPAIYPADGIWDTITGAVSAGCDKIGACHSAKETIKETTKKVTAVADFTSDPLGYIATSIQKACEDITRGIFGALDNALHPDFSVDWFLSAYRVSFALAIVLMGFLVMTELARYRKGERGADEMLTTIIGSIPKFFLGVIMGPWIGNVLGACVGALCDGLIKWGGGNEGGIASIGGGLVGLISGTSATSVLGGAIVAIIIFGIMIVSLLAVSVAMLVMMLALYMSGAAFPIGWAWVTSSRNKDTAFKIVNLIIGLMLSPPLMLFMLGVVMSLVKSNLLSAGGNKGDGVTHLLSIILAILALLMAAVAPMAFTKFAPVGIRATDGSGMPGSGSRGGGKKSSSSDGQLSQVSRQNASKSDSGGSGGASGKASGGSLGGGTKGAGGGAAGGGAAGGGAAGGGAAGGAGGGAAGGAGGGAAGGVAAVVETGKKVGHATDKATDAAMENGTDTSGSSESSSGGAKGSGGSGASSSQTAQAGKKGTTSTGGASKSSGSEGSATSRAAGGATAAATKQSGSGSNDGNAQSGPFVGAGSSGRSSGGGSSSRAASSGSSGSGGGKSSKSGEGGQTRSALHKAGSALGRVQQVGQRVNQESTKHTHHQHGGHK